MNTGWQKMATAPKNREILVRRNNDVCFDYAVVWWDPAPDDEGGTTYPWRSEYTAYPEGRLDAWHEIPR